MGCVAASIPVIRIKLCRTVQQARTFVPHFLKFPLTNGLIVAKSLKSVQHKYWTVQRRKSTLWSFSFCSNETVCRIENTVMKLSTSYRISENNRMRNILPEHSSKEGFRANRNHHKSWFFFDLVTFSPMYVYRLICIGVSHNPLRPAFRVHTELSLGFSSVFPLRSHEKWLNANIGL